MTPKPHRKSRATSGFTLAEIILVVAVMAILVSLSTPPIIEFLKRRDIQNEQNTLVEITKAMRTYLIERADLPAVTALGTCTGGTQPAWAVALARYSNLSANQIACDTWNRPRAYLMLERQEAFLGTTINVYYASVHSSGPNLQAQGASVTSGGPADATPGISISGNNFGTTTGGTTWWSRISNDEDKLNAFVAMQPAGDDQLIRFTDYPDKVEKYKISLERLERIAQALESYSKTKYNEAVVACGGSCGTLPENFIYYPRAASVGSPADVAGYYHPSLAADLTTYNGGAVINNGANNNTRRTHMISLMRMLGLPDENCCNALVTFTPSAGGKPLEMPFYYFSNPRPRNSAGGCQNVRPNPATGRTLPARLTIADGAAACG